MLTDIFEEVSTQQLRVCRDEADSQNPNIGLLLSRPRRICLHPCQVISFGLRTGLREGFMCIDVKLKRSPPRSTWLFKLVIELERKLSNSPPHWIMSLAGVALGVKVLRLALTQVSNSSSCSIAGRSIHDNQNLSHS